jgi:hypothetical protein
MKYTASFLKGEGFWEVKETGTRKWYSAFEEEDGSWKIMTHNLREISPTSKMGKAMLKAINSTSERLFALKIRGN